MTRVFSAQRRPAHLLPPLLLPSGRVTPGWLGTRHSPLGRGQPAVTAEWGLLRSARRCARTHVLQAGPAGPSGHQRCPVPADASPGRVCRHKLAHVVESGVEAAQPLLPFASPLFIISTRNHSVGNDRLFSGFCFLRVRYKFSMIFYKIWTWDRPWIPRCPSPEVAVCRLHWSGCPVGHTGQMSARFSQISPALSVPTNLDVS